MSEAGEVSGSSFESAFASLRVCVLMTCQIDEDWPTKVAAGVRAAFDFAVADAEAARVLTTTALAGGADGIARHERLIGYFAEWLYPGRNESSNGEILPEVMERALVGGILTLVAHRLKDGKEEELPTLVPEAVEFVLTPYLGAEEAHRVGVTQSAG